MHSTLDFAAKPDTMAASSQQPAASSQQPAASSQQHNSVIQVVLAVFDPEGTYSSYAGVVVASLFTNTLSKVNVTILHDHTLTSDNRQRFERTAESWHQNMSFIDVSEHIHHVVKNPDCLQKHLTRGSLYRLLIPDLLDVPKVIYLDCDVIVNMDIAELWNVPLENQKASLAAVSYPTQANWFFNYDAENYFNSGVLLMDLSKIKTKYNFIQDISCFFKRYNWLIEVLQDEICLNILFKDDVFFLEKRFNICWDVNVTDNSIIHFQCTQPWRLPQNTPRNRLFWRIFTETEWRDQLAGITTAIFKNKALGFHSIDCVKLLLSRVPKHLRLKKRVFAFAAIFKELCYRLAQRLRDHSNTSSAS